MSNRTAIAAYVALAVTIALAALAINCDSAHTRPMPQNYSLWVKIGRCEQPGKGYRGVYWAHPGPTYQGGLGFFHRTWDYYKPRGYPADAGQATWRQQMRVANRVAADVGFTAWGCYRGR